MTTYHAGDREHPTIGDAAAADEIDRLVLDAVAKQGPFRSIGEAGRALYDPAGFVQTADLLGSLDRLGRAGLVAVRRQKSDQTVVWIVAEPKGFERAGVSAKPTAHEVGRTVGAPLRATDGTDFRTHGRSAVGGEITRRTVPREVTLARLRADGSWSRAKQNAIPEADVWPVVRAIGASKRNAGVTLLELNRRLGLKFSSMTRLRARRAADLGLVRIEPRKPGHNAMRFYLTDAARLGLREMAVREIVPARPDDIVSAGIPFETASPAILAQPTPTRGYPALAAWRQDVADFEIDAQRYMERGMADVAELLRSKMAPPLDLDAFREDLVRLIDDLGGLVE